MDLDNFKNRRIHQINNFSDKQDLQTQLELLKESLKNKEEEIFQILQEQKEEYEYQIKNKDEEISKLLDQLVIENTDLKRQIINLEIDHESLKESYDESVEKLKKAQKYEQINSETFQNSNSLIDKQFFNNLKNIEDNHNKKQKEFADKYDILFKNLNKEHRVNLSNLKKICSDNQNKLNFEDFELITLNQVEDILFQLENKMKNVYEDMKNKENYSIVIEHKYDMINEENKFLKRKVAEEKNILLKKIDEIQRERDNNHNELVKKFEDEIASNKNGLNSHIQQNLETNQKLILSLTKERDELLQITDVQKKNINEFRNELTLSIQDREELDVLLMGKEITLKELNQKLDAFQIESEILNQEKSMLTISIGEINTKLQESIAKNLNIEFTNKILNDNLISLTNELKKINQEHEKQIKSLMINNDAEINEFNKKINEYKQNLENYSKLKETIDRIKIENNDFTSKIKIITQERDEEKRYRIKYENIVKYLNEDIDKLNVEIKQYKENNNELETSKRSLSFDLTTLKKNYDQLLALTESNKNTIRELEKANEKSQKYSIIEKTNADLRRELLNNKQYIKKTYDNIKRQNDKYPDLKLIIRQLDDDIKILDEIENYCRDLILKKKEITAIVNTEDVKKTQKLKEENDKMTKIINDFTNEKIKNEEDLKTLKKKLLYHNINLNNLYFKTSENSKQTQNVLYESIIVFLRNINMKYVIDLYEVKVENEAKRKLPTDPNYSKKYELLLLEFQDFKKECQILFNEFDIRSKNYFTPEELSIKYFEFKTYCEEMFDFIFSTFISHKNNEFDDFIIFKMPVNTFNQIVEKIHEGLEDFDKKINLILNEYSMQIQNTQSALDLIVKQTRIDNEQIDKILANPISNKII